MIQQVQGELIFRIDHPDEEEPILLQTVHWKGLYIRIRKLRVAQCNASGGVGSGELPRGIHHDDIKLTRLDEWLPVVGSHIRMDGNTVWWNLQDDNFEGARS